MNIEYGNGNSYCGSNSLIFAWSNPFSTQRAGEEEMRLTLGYRRERDPEQPPRPERGDTYIMIGTIVGLIVFGAAGAIVGYHYLGIVVASFCCVGGAIVGGIIGATVGSLIKKRIVQRRGKTKTNAQEPFIEKL